MYIQQIWQDLLLCLILKLLQALPVFATAPDKLLVCRGNLSMSYSCPALRDSLLFVPD
jgi:hypothetical protein